MRIIVALILGILVFVIGITLLFGGHKNTSNTTKPVVKTLPDYADSDAEVSFTTDGTINGDDLHRQIRIRVNRGVRVLEIVQGYNGQVIDRHVQQNNLSAYTAFLKALNGAGFTLARKGAKLTADYSTICPLQNRYNLAVKNGSATLSQLWSSDCGNASGDFGGAFDVVQTLFQEQITGYADLTNQVALNP
jgi:hypothetical protein